MLSVRKHDGPFAAIVPRMVKERIPEHPDLVHERRETVVGLVIAFGFVLIIFGTIILGFAGTTENLYANMVMPAAVREAVSAERMASYVLMIVGGAVAVIGFIGWTRVRRPGNLPPS